MPHESYAPTDDAGRNALERVRAVCLALPETFEKTAWGESTFRVGNEKKSRMFAMFSNNHHGDGRIALLCASDTDERRILLESEPATYYIPPYVGTQGWVGIILDRADDTALAECVKEAYQRVAPKRLLEKL